jgi:hypothetical protein
MNSPDSDKAGISLIRCENEKDLQHWNLDQMARELTGKELLRMFPIYLVFYHGQLRGYAHTIPQLVVYPALHPDKMSPRVFLKLTRSLITEFKRMTGNPLFLLCEKAEALGPKNLRRIRLKRAPETAYIYDEEVN